DGRAASRRSLPAVRYQGGAGPRTLVPVPEGKAAGARWRPRPRRRDQLAFLLVSRKAFSLSAISVLPREIRLSPSAICCWPFSTCSLPACFTFSPWATRSLPFFHCLLMSSMLAACCFILSPSGAVLAQPVDRTAATATSPSVTRIFFIVCTPSKCCVARAVSDWIGSLPQRPFLVSDEPCSRRPHPAAAVDGRMATRPPARPTLRKQVLRCFNARHIRRPAASRRSATAQARSTCTTQLIAFGP